MSGIRKTVPISEHFSAAAKALGEGMSAVLSRMDERDKAELAVRDLEAQLESARAKLEVYERRFSMVREMMEPQNKFYLLTMERESEDALARLRTPEAALAADSEI